MGYCSCSGLINILEKLESIEEGQQLVPPVSAGQSLLNKLLRN